MKNKICNLDCFHCIHPDCIRDELGKKHYPNYQSQRDSRKRRYYRWKQAGLCVRCGKRNATHGVVCTDCYYAKKRSDHNRNCTGARELWREQGKCVCCGAEPVMGKKTCEKHRAAFATGAEKARASKRAQLYRERAKQFVFGDRIGG